jgi:hypothetical protein
MNTYFFLAEIYDSNQNIIKKQNGTIETTYPIEKNNMKEVIATVGDFCKNSIPENGSFLVVNLSKL